MTTILEHDSPEQLLPTVPIAEETSRCDEEELRCNEERCRLALEATSDGLWDWNTKTGKVYYSPSFLRMLGYEPEPAPCSLSFWQDLIHPDERAQALAVFQDCIQGYGPFQVEYRILARDGNWLWVLCRGNSISRNEAGRHLRLVGTHENITERKELEARITQLVAEKDLILRDVHHRVKNNLSTLRSLLSLQSQSMRSKPAASALQVAAGRVQSMAMLYDRLYLSGDFGSMSSKDFMLDLVDQILCNFPNFKHIVVIKEIEDIKLPQRAITGLSLIVNEVLTNAMKYAFNNREVGLIRIRLARGAGSFELEIQDDGPGFTVTRGDREEEGFGFLLIRTLTDQLQGRLELDDSAGTRIRMDFPLADKVA